MSDLDTIEQARLAEWEELAAELCARKHDRLGYRGGAALVGALALLSSERVGRERAEKGYAQLRAIAEARPPDTELRDTYADGYTAGLIEAIHVLNRAALSPEGTQA